MNKDKPHRSPCSLHLPVEIALYILQAASSASCLKSLILVAPSFNNVWKAYTASISSVVLGRSIEGFDDVLKLEETVHPQLAAGFEPALERHKRLSSAASLASSAFEDFVYDYPHTFSCNLWHVQPYLAEPLGRRSFKRCFYWLWMLVITSEYKPLVFHQPLDPFPLRRSDTLCLCELIIWIVLGSGKYTTPSSIFGKAYRIYHLKDRVRCAQHRRWELCCKSLWQQVPFQQARRDHWSLDLGMTVPAGWHGALDTYNPWFRPRLLFLTSARAAHTAIYRVSEREEVRRTPRDGSWEEHEFSLSTNDGH